MWNFQSHHELLSHVEQHELSAYTSSDKAYIWSSWRRAPCWDVCWEDFLISIFSRTDCTETWSDFHLLSLFCCLHFRFSLQVNLPHLRNFELHFLLRCLHLEILLQCFCLKFLLLLSLEGSTHIVLLVLVWWVEQLQLKPLLFFFPF